MSEHKKAHFCKRNQRSESGCPAGFGVSSLGDIKTPNGQNAEHPALAYPDWAGDGTWQYPDVPPSVSNLVSLSSSSTILMDNNDFTS